MRYQLNKAIDVPITVRVSRTVKSGGIEIGRFMQLEPGTLYETDDAVMADSLKAYTVRKKYTPMLEETLKANNADYEVIICKRCGGKRKEIEYHPVEVEK